MHCWAALQTSCADYVHSFSLDLAALSRSRTLRMFERLQSPHRQMVCWSRQTRLISRQCPIGQAKRAGIYPYHRGELAELRGVDLPRSRYHDGERLRVFRASQVRENVDPRVNARHQGQTP